MSRYRTLINTPKKDLIELINKSKSRIQILRHFGFNGSDPRAFRFINQIITEEQIDISHFKRQNLSRYTINDLKKAVEESFCISDVLRKLNLSVVGGNANTIKRLIGDHEIDTNHFDIKMSMQKNKVISTKEELKKESTLHRTTLRNLILREQLLEYKCDECGLTKWKDREITLDLDHINGIRDDNRLQNLRFLCPNCHSQTSTYRGKNNETTEYISKG